MEYMEKVYENADPEWLALAERAVLAVSKEKGEFTVDDIWELIPACREPRALGAIIRRMSKQGIIVATGRYKESSRSACHHRPVLIWRKR